MKKIIVGFSRDLRKSRLIEGVYSALRDRGLDPTFVNSSYSVTLGIGEAVYTFKNEVVLPEKSELEEMLVGRNFNSLTILEDEETPEEIGLQ